VVCDRKTTFSIKTFLKNFQLSDFYCRCGICQDQVIDLSSCCLLQGFRDYINLPIYITSAYRCPSHNAKVKGAPDSMHLVGAATDIYVTGMTSIELAKRAMNYGYKRIGVGASFVHIDIKPTDKLTVWVYNPVSLADVKAALGLTLDISQGLASLLD
jgi:glyoxylate carboligase